jgi:glyoxylase-like metal-dependent hydrolase (beta-lactamase superfamily II)
MSNHDTYEVFAVRYATMKRKANENFINGDPHEDAADLDYFVWLARNAKRSFVIDTGFSEHVGRKRNRFLLREPAQGLRLLGVDAAQTRDVIITHMHYDHLGNFAQFPNARYHLQDAEMMYATGRHMSHNIFRHPYEPDEVCELVRAVHAGRVQFHDGEEELAPGISVHRIGGHTMGIQSVRVRTKIGWIVLASDATHFYANMDEVRPFPIVFSIGDMVQGYAKLKSLADDPAFVVPGHDPLVMQRYPSAGAGLEGIAVRLDVEPALLSP